VQQRGAPSSRRAAFFSRFAGNAVIDTVRFLTTTTPKDDWHSVADLLRRKFTA